MFQLFAAARSLLFTVVVSVVLLSQYPSSVIARETDDAITSLMHCDKSFFLTFISLKQNKIKTYTKLHCYMTFVRVLCHYRNVIKRHLLYSIILVPNNYHEQMQKQLLETKQLLNFYQTFSHM